MSNIINLIDIAKKFNLQSTGSVSYTIHMIRKKKRENKKLSKRVNALIKSDPLSCNPEILNRGVEYVYTVTGETYDFFDTYHRILLGEAMMSMRRHGVE